jgi:hypothetical protein
MTEGVGDSSFRRYDGGSKGYRLLETVCCFGIELGCRLNEGLPSNNRSFLGFQTTGFIISYWL